MRTIPFNLAAVKSVIAGSQFAGHLHHLASTSSTMDLALKAARSGKRNGVWIADRQIAGRGRGVHHWHSPAGAGLYMTSLIAPPIPMPSALGLSFRVAIAVQSAIVSLFQLRLRDEIDIRWPNDLLLNRRKVGGILIDTASNPARPGAPATLRYAIVGIGINLNHTTFPPELEAIATSLRREMPQPAAPLRREPLAAAILLALDAEIRTLVASKDDSFAQPSYSTYSSWLSGKRVCVGAHAGHPGYTGVTAGLNPSGFLLVNGEDGKQHTVLSGGLREAAD